ncbi:uncharacterized protein M6B38_291480 [Iris pallida]|uniref:FMR1-interacting protein 1 conserved domain-containing protein n=2 Tax=Iris pallida TaxID=29817 RepID=A0AAX6HT21_IRIPA|nr:uncharacterized protein M6B38_291480 [Iris pallida]
MFRREYRLRPTNQRSIMLKSRTIIQVLLLNIMLMEIQTENFLDSEKDNLQITGIFQKSQPHDMRNPKGNMKPFNKNCKRGHRNQRGGKLVSANFEEAATNQPRYVINYPENEIQQWREARKKNFPTRDNINKKLTSGGKSGEYDNDDKLRRLQLKEVLAKQAELGVEVAEIPSSYFHEPGEQVHGNEIELWRQARKKNFPTSANIKKESAKDTQSNEDASGNNKLSYQAKLGVAVAEIPPSYRPYEQVPKMNNDVEDPGDGKVQKRKLMDIDGGPSPCKPNNKRGRRKWQKAKNNAATASPSIVKRAPSLLQKLLTADIKRDKSRLLQVFRFMVLNDFFKNGPDMPLKFPVITAKGDAGFGVEVCGRKNQSSNGVEVEPAAVGVAKNEAAGEISSQKEPDVAYEVQFGFGTDDNNDIADEETVHLVENEDGKRAALNEISEEGEIID